MKPSKTNKWIQLINAQRLSVIYILSLMLPVLILVYTERNPFWVSVACVMIPLGGYSLFVSFWRHSGWMVWLGLPFVFLGSFQIVLSYLFRNSVVSADMFLNVLTTNSAEAGELLANIYPAVIAVIVIYVPLLWLAVVHIRCREILASVARLRLAMVGVAALLIGSLALIFGCRHHVRQVLRDEVFPVNATYNMWVAMAQAYRIANFHESSKNFRYHARRENPPLRREVYVLIIGEASRAASWQLFGYERMTNPLLFGRDDVVLFGNVITQSNTTHKSVPMMLSSVHPSQHDELYRRSGIPALFNEVGFTTYFISNQSPQGAMIDNLAHDATHVIYVDSPRLDRQLVDAMREALAQDRSMKLLFILHTYGSHYSYHRRYPPEFACFQPDDDVTINRSNVEMIRNAYDNSICYTDYVINEVITTLEGLNGGVAAMFYCADHGEDLYDNAKNRFLHSSPMVTYHQLHVASLAWFSPKYIDMYGEKVMAARCNEMAPATTYSVFHTMADMAHITSPYVVRSASLLNRYFDYGAVRYYLNDHYRAVKLDDEIGLDAEERAYFISRGIKP